MAEATLRPPRGFYKRGKYWWVNTRICGARLRCSTHQTTIEAALAWWDVRRGRARELLAPRRGRAAKSEALTLYYSARNRAIKNGIEFGITVLDVMMLFERSRNRCELTGIPFSDERIGLCRRAPFRASLDRKVAAGAYTPDNVRLVCVAVNTALGEWGEAVFRRIALQFSGHVLGHTKEPVL